MKRFTYNWDHYLEFNVFALVSAWFVTIGAILYDDAITLENLSGAVIVTSIVLLYNRFA